MTMLNMLKEQYIRTELMHKWAVKHMQTLKSQVRLAGIVRAFVVRQYNVEFPMNQCHNHNIYKACLYLTHD